MPRNDIYYSDKYYDDSYEYRHVHLPKDLATKVPKDKLMSEAEWRALGVCQSQGWEHYMVHAPEQHILLFRRLRTDRPLQVGKQSQCKMSVPVMGMGKVK